MRVKGRAGSALIWAVAASMILVILVSAALAVAGRSANRTLAEADRRQAYLTARSAVDVLLSQLSGWEIEIAEPEGAAFAAPRGQEDPLLWQRIEADNPLLAREGSVAIEDFAFEDSAGMGAVEAAFVGRLEGGDFWQVSATARCGDAVQQVSAVLQLHFEAAPTGAPPTAEEAIPGEGAAPPAATTYYYRWEFLRYE